LSDPSKGTYSYDPLMGGWLNSSGERVSSITTVNTGRRKCTGGYTTS
jgi:hypothetical protein